MSVDSQNRLSFLDAAARALGDVDRPLTPSQIVDHAKKAGYLSSLGQTPSQTLKSKLSVDVLTKRERSRFMRVDKNLFGLRLWGDRYPEYTADRYQKALLDEQIVVFERSYLPHLLPGPGLYCIDSESSAGLIAQTFPMQRRDAEEDPSVIQLVSAFLVREDERIATYKRTARLPEKRLQGVHSLLFGGHLNPDDVPPLFGIFDPQLGPIHIARELSEELRFQNPPRLTLVGVLYDDRREVSLQHLGILYTVDVPAGSSVEIGERGFLQQLRFESPQEISERMADFENWSELVMREYVMTLNA